MTDGVGRGQHRRVFTTESGSTLTVEHDDGTVLLAVDQCSVELTHTEARAFGVAVVLAATEAKEDAEGS